MARKTAQQLADDEPTLTIQQAADQLGVHYATIRRWIDAGQLRAHKMGPRLVRISQNDLNAVYLPRETHNGRSTARGRTPAQDDAPARKPGQAGRK